MNRGMVWEGDGEHDILNLVLCVAWIHLFFTDSSFLGAPFSPIVR